MYAEQNRWLWRSNILEDATASSFLYKFIDFEEDLAASIFREDFCWPFQRTQTKGKKLHFTLEQVLEAQKGSRGIAEHFL